MEQEQIVQLASLALALLAGAGSTTLINWLKTTFRLHGNSALIATAAVATVIAVLSLIVEGQLTPAGVSWDNLPAVFTAVFVASQARFRMLQDRAVAGAVAVVGVQAAAAQQTADEAMVKADKVVEVAASVIQPLDAVTAADREWADKVIAEMDEYRPRGVGVERP
jgi:hypothetical protein